MIGETFFKESGRFSFIRESVVAVHAIGHEARDGILDFMDKEERLFMDFHQNVRNVLAKAYQSSAGFKY